MDLSLLLSFHYGASKDIYFSFKGSGREGEVVRCLATVEKISFTHDTKDPTVIAFQRLPSIYGFSVSVQSVILESKQQVRYKVYYSTHGFFMLSSM